MSAVAALAAASVSLYQAKIFSEARTDLFHQTLAEKILVGCGSTLENASQFQALMWRREQSPFLEGEGSSQVNPNKVEIGQIEKQPSADVQNEVDDANKMILLQTQLLTDLRKLRLVAPTSVLSTIGKLESSVRGYYFWSNGKVKLDGSKPFIDDAISGFETACRDFSLGLEAKQ